MQKQMTENRDVPKIPAFVEPVSSCPGEISELAESVAKSYGIPLTTLNDYSGDKEQVVQLLWKIKKTNSIVFPTCLLVNQGVLRMHVNCQPLASTV